MKITIFSIVYNILETLPDKMFELNIQNMYDFVDEIIIVEGATTEIKTDTNGRSNDGTIDFLKKLEKKYNKIKIIIGSGYWKDKIEMCNAASKNATGDYLWQLDSDEFYKHEDIIKIKKLLEERKPDSIHFFANHFFGGFDKYIDENGRRWGNDIPWKRIFKHKPGKSFWIEHRPPTYICDGKNCDNGVVINRNETLSLGLKMFHYSYVQESQIKFKSSYFKNENYNFFFGEKVKIFREEHPEIIKKNYL